MHGPASVLENETHKLDWDFKIQTDPLNLGQTTTPYNNKQQNKKKNNNKRTCRIVDFALPADHKVELKGSEKKNKYLDLAWEMKKLWNISDDCYWCSWYCYRRIGTRTVKE